MSAAGSRPHRHRGSAPRWRNRRPAVLAPERAGM